MTHSGMPSRAAFDIGCGDETMARARSRLRSNQAGS